MESCMSLHENMCEKRHFPRLLGSVFFVFEKQVILGFIFGLKPENKGKMVFFKNL